MVQEMRDPFGIPSASEHRVVVEVPGDHSLKADPAAVSSAVQSRLAEADQSGVLSPRTNL